MNKAYAMVHIDEHRIYRVSIKKLKIIDPAFYLYECELGSYQRLRDLEENKVSFHDVKFIIDGNVLYCKDIYEHIVEQKKIQRLENKIDNIVECADSNYPYTSNYKTLFNTLSIEEKVDAVFELSFRALTRLKQKEDKPY